MYEKSSLLAKEADMRHGKVKRYNFYQFEYTPKDIETSSNVDNKYIPCKRNASIQNM